MTMQNYLVNELSEISLSMFRKNFFGIYHGSISARTEHDNFIVNKKNAIFDRLGESSLIELCSKKDYRWNDASIDAEIHLGIYANIGEAKYACYAMPPYTIAYTLNHNNIIPKDYFGLTLIGKTNIYDPKQFEDWYERADVEIYRYFIEKNTNIMIVKGYGIFAYDRDIHSLAKNVALIENTCRVLLLAAGEK
ncbi:MAG: class II aldolase and adducin N-terminal domain-containing protein [Campylobacteraceae bacterium]|jgi:L-fuculose-phosphate aldolase|nr:class II aldolase and adducin N-terminal domain-containing protein [Campylobacteraceae bacterium]